MEFEDLQHIWNKQENESLYAINEAALYKQIQKKSKSVDFALNMLEWGVIGTSLFAIFSLWLNWEGEGIPWGYYLIPAMLIIISGYVYLFRQHRQKRAQQFEPTMMGELEKAIAQNDFLVERIETMVWWYMLPIYGGFIAYFYYEQGTYWWQSMLFTVVVGVLSYAGTKWELRKFHLPKKRDLEALRKLLLQSK